MIIEVVIIIIIKSTNYVQDMLPLFVGCNMQVRLIETSEFITI